MGDVSDQIVPIGGIDGSDEDEVGEGEDQIGGVIF